MLGSVGRQCNSALWRASAQSLHRALTSYSAQLGADLLRQSPQQTRLISSSSAMVAEHGPSTSGREQIESHLGAISTGPMIPEASPIVLVISGPSGVGKDAVVKALQEMRPDLYFVITATSRAMRPGEVEGSDYFFVSKDKFEQWLQEGNLLEHAVVYGEYKGIPRHQVEHALRKGSDVVLRIDVQGAETIRKVLPHSVHIFLVAESEAKLVDRLVSRKTEPLDKLLTRIQTARNECKHIDNFDYVVVNRDGKLKETVSAIASVIEAEKLRVHAQKRTHHILADS